MIDAEALPRLGYTMAEAAKVLGVSTRTLWRIVSQGKLRTMRIGGPKTVRLAVDEVHAFFEAARSERGAA